MSKVILPPLRRFQEQAVAEMCAANPIRYLLADDTGLGKTCEMLRVIFRRKLYPALIVVPASLRLNWAQETQTFIAKEALTLLGKRPIIAPGSLRTSDLTLIGYDVLQDWLPVLRNVGYAFLGADEGQNLGGRNSRRSIAFRVLAQDVRNIIIATGSPIMNYPAELWPIVSCLWPDEFDSDFDFYSRYCATGDKQRGRFIWTGAKNLGSLRSRMRSMGLIRRLKSEVLTELPAKQTSVVRLPIARPEEYARADTDFLSWLAGWAGMVRARTASRAIQFARFSYMKRLAAELKLPAVIDWLRNWLESCEYKCLVFGIHRQSKPWVLQRIFTEFEKVAVQIHGGLSDKQKEENKQRFQNDKSIRMCVCQIKAAGVGLNLQAAQAAIHVELAWNDKVHSQATARAHRMGNTQRVNEYFLLADVPIERKLAQLIQEKERISNLVLDGTEDVVGSLNVFDRLTEELLAEQGK